MPVMQNLERILARELNPLRDFDRVKPMPCLFSSQREPKFMNQLYGAVNLVKHFFRGGLIGAATGYVVGEVTGAPTTEAVKTGAAVGLTIDMLQYQLRLLFSETIKDTPRVYGSVRTWLSQRL